MHWIWKNTIISSVTGFGIFIFLFHSETGQAPDLHDHVILLVTALVFCNLLGMGLRYINLQFNPLLPWNKNIAARFFLEVSAGLFLVGLVSLFYAWLFLNDLKIPGSEDTFWLEYWDGAVKFGLLSLVIVYIHSLVNFSVFSYNQYAVHQIDMLREERSQLNLQFDALRTQLSPHFLFNALNTVSSLIYKDIHLAEDFIRRLAYTYRHILQTNERRLIPVKSEMEMLHSYSFMQKIKYENCIELRVNLPEEVMNSWIPPLTLQMLMENALKHNMICEDMKLVIELSAEDRFFLVVKNNIIPLTELLKIGNNLIERPREIKSHNIGLNNIRSRYAFFTHRKIEVTKDQYFIVKLPIIEQDFE